MAGRARAPTLVVIAAALGCGGRSVDAENDDGPGRGGASGGSDSRGGTSTGGTSTGGTSGSSGSAAAGTPGMECDERPPPGASPDLVLPDCSGWIENVSNPFEINGQWYAFGDQYPGPYDERCLLPGMHRPEECSIVWSPPPPPAIGFPQTVRGTMCTTGEAATVLPCQPALQTAGCPEADYWNMMGAGIGVDFNAEGAGRDSPRHPWDPAVYGVIGFSFDIDVIPEHGLRVEIPMLLTDDAAAAAVPPVPPGSTTESHPELSPYWGADERWPSSPAVIGTNRVLFSDIHHPTRSYEFDPRRMLGIQFHVPTTTRSPKATYGFCISNLTLLRK